MLDPVFLFFDHLIQTKMLPRKMASKTFFEKFTEYCEKEGYPTPKDMETVAKIIDSVPLSRFGFDMDYMVRVFVHEIQFPDPEMLKKYLDKLVIEFNLFLTEEPQLGVDLIGPKGTRSLEEIENSPLKRCSFKAKENGLCMRHQLNKKEYENDGICQANCGLVIEREKRQARRRESYKKNPERERESSRRNYWKKKGLSPPIESEYDALRAEIIKRQNELDKMRSNFKSLGSKKRKLEIEEEEKM